MGARISAATGPADERAAHASIAPGWRAKALLPVAGVLLGGLLVFIWVTLSFEQSQRHAVILVAAAGAVAVGAVLLLVLAVLIQRPLTELQKKIAQVRAGDFSVSVSFAGRRDEIGELGRNFNAMVRELRETREELQRLHRTQMSRAEHLATLGELAAGLAHEIRNPLAGVAGVIDVIGRELPEGSPNREILKEVQGEVLHIKQILSELLDYARPKPPNFQPADLNATAEHAVALARQQTLSRPIEIKLAKAERLPPVEHDPMQIQQLLLNLMLNAIQAIGEAGRIDVIVESRSGFAAITVSDTGRGIAPEHLPNIFRPFFTTKGQGTGLGLSLARRIAEDHGGRIEVISQPGAGTRFTLLLPMEKAALSDRTSVVK
jgi:two-component system NtrC family sensor kinase